MPKVSFAVLSKLLTGDHKNKIALCFERQWVEKRLHELHVVAAEASSQIYPRKGKEQKSRSNK